MNTGLVSIGIVAVIAVCIVAGFVSYVQVPVGYVGLVLQQSKLTDTVLQPGPAFITPFLQSVVEIQTAHAKEQLDLESSSHDQQDVKTTVAVEYFITPSNARQIYATYLGQHETTLLQPQIQGVTKSIISQYTVVDLIQKRPAVNDAVENALKDKLTPYGITVVQTSLTNFVAPQSFTDAVNAKVKAEQDAQTEENKVKVVQAQADQAIAAAEGQAKSIKIVNDALAGSPAYLQWKGLDVMNQKWDGRLPMAIGTGGIPLLQMPTGGNLP